MSTKTLFDFNKLKNFDKVKSADFMLRVDNEFPIDIKVQMEFLDQNDTVLLVLFTDNNRVDAADINPGSEKTLGPKRSFLLASVDETNLDILRDAVKVRTRAIFDTPGSQRYKMFSNYELSTKLSADFIYEQSL